MTFSDEAQQVTRQLSGSDAEIDDSSEGNAALALLDSLKQYSDNVCPPITKLNAGNYVIYHITPD